MRNEESGEELSHHRVLIGEIGPQIPEDILTMELNDCSGLMGGWFECEWRLSRINGSRHPPDATKLIMEL